MLCLFLECVTDGFGELGAFRSEEGLVRVTAQEAIQVFDELWVSPPTFVRSRAVFPVPSPGVVQRCLKWMGEAGCLCFVTG